MKLSDDRRTTWPPPLAKWKPFKYETPSERGQLYTIRDADLLVGDGLDLGECFVDLSCEGPDGPAGAMLGPYRPRLAQSVLATLRKLRGQRLAQAGEVEIDVP